MDQQAGLLFYKFRFLFAGILTIAFLTLISALVTATGSNTILASSSVDILDSNVNDNPNFVTASAYELADDSKRVMLSTGMVFYRACRSITNLAAQSARSTIHGGAVALHGIWMGIVLAGRGIGSGIVFVVHGISSGIVSAARGIGNGIMFTLRIPWRIAAFIISGHPVSAIIRPADSHPVPLISAETSAAALARFNARQQQEIAKLQAAQLVANRDLGGSIVAGDPSHGGYPSKWDAAEQDRTLDSWGMYNRECVSYAAWKVYQTYGYMPYWGGVGNASQWVRNAKAADIETGSTPQVHSVAISMHGYYGHAMWVEAVSGDMIYVSQYNYDLHGHYSEMWINSSYFTYIYFK